MTLAEGIAEYLVRKRALGMRHVTEQSILKSFLKFAGNVALDHEIENDVLLFLELTSRTAAVKASKCRLLIRFYTFWHLRELARPLNIPTPKTTAVNARVPYVYSENQVRLLLNAADECQGRSTSAMAGQSLRVLVLLLYSTGMTIREALELRADAFDAPSELLEIHCARHRNTRTIPLCQDLCKELAKYELWKSRVASKSSYFIATAHGRPLSPSTLVTMFQRLRRIALPMTAQSPHVRVILQDMRPTFAVHRITAWIRCGADMNRLLPALAVYMGLTGLESTQKYMALTPERFRTELNKLSPAGSSERWADDKQLMAFLNTL